jgi:hypothetical protein
MRDAEIHAQIEDVLERQQSDGIGLKGESHRVLR